MPIPPGKLEAFANGKPGKGKPKGPPGPPPKKGGPPPKTSKDHAEPDGDEDEGGDDHSDVDVEAIGERVQSGKGDKRLMKLSAGVDEENNPPESVLDEDLWEEARDAVDPTWDEYDQPWAVVMHVYDAMGGELADGGGGK